MIPESVGNYRVIGPLGQGSTGVVYQAVEQASERKVALKLVAPERFRGAAARAKFLEEARAAARFSHPRVRQLYEVGESGDQIFLAMEYLEGGTLRNLLVAGPLAPESMLAWGGEIADALGELHAAGLVHGELTPGKVFVTQGGEVKLLDPGLWRMAVPVGADLSQEAAVRGSGVPATTLAALAPEQLSGCEPDARSDLFSLGVLLYQMSTGRHPFADPDAVQTMHWVLRRAPELPSHWAVEVPAAFDAVVASLLAKTPAERPAGAGPVAAALRAVASGEEPPAELLAPLPSARRLTWPLWIAIGAVLLILILWFFILARS